MASADGDHTVAVNRNPDLVPRRAEALVAEALTDTRVVTLNGARQTGKSTLARIAVQNHPNTLVRLLDDPATLRAAQSDSTSFVEHDGLMVIDEIQLAPELFRSIKVAVDTDQRPGQFLLTGSAQVLALRGLPDAQPGRMEIIELWPFSQGELERSPDAFVDAAFGRGAGLSWTSTLRKRDYLERIVRGGYPEAVRRSPRRRAAFFDSYLTNLIERDVKELAAIERRGDLRRLLALLAAVLADCSSRRHSRPRPASPGPHSIATSNCCPLFFSLSRSLPGHLARRNEPSGRQSSPSSIPESPRICSGRTLLALVNPTERPRP